MAENAAPPPLPQYKCDLSSYLGQTELVVSKPLFVFLHFPRHHLPRPEVETSQIHCVAKVTGQLRLTPELLP